MYTVKKALLNILGTEWRHHLHLIPHPVCQTLNVTHRIYNELQEVMAQGVFKVHPFIYSFLAGKGIKHRSQYPITSQNVGILHCFMSR